MLDWIKQKIRALISPPHTLADFHLALTIFWITAIIPTLLFWRDSVLWVAFMSLWANIVSHATGYSASKAEKAVEAAVNRVEEETRDST